VLRDQAPVARDRDVQGLLRGNRQDTLIVAYDVDVCRNPAEIAPGDAELERAAETAGGRQSRR
jgi:hypothetical protein